MISYQNIDGDANKGIKVRLGKRIIGTIRKHEEGWRYHPKGSTLVGDAYPSLGLCKRSLTSDDMHED